MPHRVMREYGVIESWTKIIVPSTCCIEQFRGCTSNGELLLETTDDFLVSFDPRVKTRTIFFQILYGSIRFQLLHGWITQPISWRA